MHNQETQAQQIWQSQSLEGVNMSMEAIRRRAQKFERRILWRNAREYVGGGISIVLFAYFFYQAHGVLFRAAFALFLLSMIWVLFQLHRKGAVKALPGTVQTVDCLHFFRSELERQRDVVLNVWPWYLAPLVPGFVVYTIAYAMAFPHPGGLAALALLDLIVAGLFFVVWKMNMRAARCLQRTIEELYDAEKQR